MPERVWEQTLTTDLVNAGLIVRRAAKNAISDDEAI